MKTLSLYEDNAGGLHLLRHSDNTIFTGLEHIYAGDYPVLTGSLLSNEQTGYWLLSGAEDSQVCYVFDTPEEADTFLSSDVTNGIVCVAEYTDDKWNVFGEMGTNARIAMGFTIEEAENMRYGIR